MGKDFKMIKRLKKQDGSEEHIRSIRLSKSLDDYCLQQGNPSEFIRSLIQQQMEEDVKEDIYISINRFFGMGFTSIPIRHKRYAGIERSDLWSEKMFDAGLTYPETLDKELSDEILDFVLQDLDPKTSKSSIASASAFALAQRCKQDEKLWNKIYQKARLQFIQKHMHK